MSTSRTRRALAVGASWLMISGLAVLAAAGVSSGTAGASTVRPAAAATNWQPLTDITGDSSQQPILNSVSCVGAGDCTAVGNDNNVAVYAIETSGVWGDTTEVSGATQLNSVSCTAVGECVAVGTNSSTQPVFVTESGGIWSGVTAFTIDSPPVQTATMYGVSCTGTGYCTAVGTDTNSSANNEPVVSTESNGAWTAVTELAGPDSTAIAGFASVSCYGSGDCTAVGETPLSTFYAVESGGSWGTPADLTDSSGQTVLNGVSCPSAGNCTAVGTANSSGVNHAVVATEINGNWTSTHLLPGTTESFGHGVSCVTVGTCTEVGNLQTGTGQITETPDYLSESGGVWGAPVAVGVQANDTLAYLNGVSCYGSGVCTAAGQDQGNSLAGYAYSTPTISGVTFTGGQSDPNVTVTGSGFGSSAAALGMSQAACGGHSGTDYLSDLWVTDTTTNNTWNGGQNGTLSCDYVGLKVLSYSDRQIVFGFGSGYPIYGHLTSGDNVTVHVLGAAFSTTVVYGPTVNPARLQVQAGASAKATLTGSLLTGATVRVTGPSALVSTSGVAVNGAGTSVSLTISAPVNATPGVYNLVVTDPNHTSATCNGCLTVTPAAARCSQTLTSGTVVGMATTADGGGYWVASSTGQVAACGDAPSFGNGPAGVAAIAAAPTGDGTGWRPAAGRCPPTARRSTTAA